MSKSELTVKLWDALRRVFWRHHWKHPDNGNPYRRFCTVCGEQQEYDRYWDVWNKGDHSKHFESPNE